MPTIPGMKGEGFYDQHSAPQGAAIQSALNWATDAVAGLRLPPDPQPVVVADLGSSEGRNAIVAMRVIVEAVRRRTGQPVQTIYSDLHSSNFNRLFINLHDVKGTFPPEVYPSAVPGSFYGPLFPPGTVHFLMSFNAVLWLDHLPALVPDFVVYRRPHPPRPGLQVAPEITAAFTTQADRDLVVFLQNRARELVSGGKLLLATPGDDTERRITDGMYDALNDACLDLVEAGQVSRQGYERLTIPTYFRTQEETLAPLQRADSPVRDALTVDRAETLEVKTPFDEEFRRTGDVAAYARALTGFLRAFSEPVARGALLVPGTDPGIIDTLYERVRTRVTAEPERYAFHYILVVVLLTRR
jgi:hypothetical protein